MDLWIARGNGQAKEIAIPPSKSLAHRLLICAGLSCGESRLEDIGRGKDILATKKALLAMGARFKEDGNILCVHGVDPHAQWARKEINCGESASTLRFFIPLAALAKQEIAFYGSGRLMERPLGPYENIFRSQGLCFAWKDGALRVAGKLMPGHYEVEGGVSSQFVSGLLMALPLLEKDSMVIAKDPFESAPYVSMTLAIMAKAGIRVGREGNIFHVPGGQTYMPLLARCEGDDTQAAVFACLAQACHRSIRVFNISHASMQGDRVFLDILKDMGARIETTSDGYRFFPSLLNGITVDLSDCPDLGPVLFAVASLAQGESVFTGCARLRLKESDRIASMKMELEKLGVEVDDHEGGIVRIHGGAKLKTDVGLDGHGDHRVVMALSVLAASQEIPLCISGCEAVEKSYPGFFADLAKAGCLVQCHK